MSESPPATGHRTRVLHIVQNLNYGGMERLLSEMLRLSDRNEFESHVLNLQYVGRFGEGLARFASVGVAPRMSRLSLLRPAKLARSIARVAPDVVHTHSGVWYKASLAARMAGVKWLIHTEHGRAIPDPWLSRRLDGAASRRTDIVVAVSDSVARRLSSTVVSDAGRVRVILNGVDVDAFTPRPPDPRLCDEIGVSGATPVLGSIGRLEPIKGFEVIVDAFAELLTLWSHEPRPVLVIAGDGSQRSVLSARAQAAGVQQHVRWLRWRDDVPALYSLFSVFTMSSHSEGTSISLLEAMSSGICPVVTDVGGNAAVLGRELRHRLVPPADPVALARAWADALANAERLKADGRLARQRVVDDFSLKTTVSAYERLYRREAVPARAAATT